MTHISEEQISAYLDRELSRDEERALELHLDDCSCCRDLRDEFLDVSGLFRNVERFEPPPDLWNRIAADFNREQSSPHSWIASFIYGLRQYGWNMKLASAAMAVLMIAGIFVYRGSTGALADRAALADIDRTYRNMAALDQETYNPFGSGLSQDLDANPFKSLRMSGGNLGIPAPSRGID